MASPHPWRKISHVIPASHPRHCYRGVRDSQVSRLKLHVSQYIPNKCVDGNPEGSGATLIVQHGLPPGDNAACLEPFLADLLEVIDIPIRSIWAMDLVNCGRSFILNETELGDQHDMLDSARDILQMVNHFQAEMKPPILAFGQSFGNVPLVVAGGWSPGLFRGIVLSEPMVESSYDRWKERGSKPGEDMTLAMVGGLYRRQTVWQSRDEVRKWYLEGKGRFIGRQYDARVMKKIIDNDYRDRPDGKIELISPPSQTVMYFVRGTDPADANSVLDPEYERRTESQKYPAGLWSPPWADAIQHGFQSLQPKVLLLWGDESVLSERKRHRIRENVGIGPRGAGGLAADQVEEIEIKGGHSLPLFVPKEVANAVSPFLKARWEDWLAEEAARRKEPPIYPKSLRKPLHDKLMRRGVKL